MKRKRFISCLLAFVLLLPTLFSLSGCAAKDTVVLRVFSWEEYIDEGGEDSYAASDKNPDPLPIIEEFEKWYEEIYQTSVRVEYSTFGTNEDMYNQLKLGNAYDLVCPSEYMIMKLIAEDMLEPLDEEFFNEDNEQNHYIHNVSPYIASVFEEDRVLNGVTHQLKTYSAGYMWGVTGLVYNREQVSDEELDSKGWSIMLDPAYKKRVTTKDNVRDSYFVGLAIEYRDELLALDKNADNYNSELTKIMNRTEDADIAAVQEVLLKMKENIFGFETDTGKSDMVKGTISMNFAWSGDAVYAMNEAEEQGLELRFHVPNEGANLYFDGWAIPKDDNRSPEVKQAAEAFINFMSIPENAVRNMDFIGYTSVIAGEEVLDYVKETYQSDDEESVPYDISDFFGEGAVIQVSKDQLKRQLFAQFPPKDVTSRCAVMNYYGADDVKINELWTKVKGATLDAWAITVICIAGAAIILAVIFLKFGSKIEIRKKPKNGYHLVNQKPMK